MPQSERKAIAEGLREVFAVKQRSTAESLAQTFVERYRDLFKRALEVFAQGLEEALTYLNFPRRHQRHIKSTNVLERLFQAQLEGKFPGETKD